MEKIENLDLERERPGDGANEDLAHQFKELMSENEILVQENQLLQFYFDRISATNHVVTTEEEHDDENEHNLDARLSTVSPKLSVPPKRKHRSKKGASSALTEVQKYSISLQELSNKQKELLDVDQTAAKELADLSAMLGETQIRINELKREEFEFKRDIAQNSINPRTRKVIAENVIKYFEAQIQAKSSVVEKIKAKNASLKTHIQKLEHQLKQKEEQGDSLHSIDFHQLKIENSQFTQKIKERNTELLQVKMTTGNTVQMLNAAKSNLNTLVSQSKWLQREIANRQETLNRLTEELSRVEDEVSSENKKNTRFKTQVSNVEMPQILDYVKLKAEQHELELSLQNWQRKIEIAELALKQARHKQKSASITSTNNRSFTNTRY